MAKLYFRYGAVNCGKSTSLLQVAFNYKERGMHVLVAKPATDTKGENLIVSRLGATRRVDILADHTFDFFEEISQIVRINPKLSCILTDESQFFTKTQITQLFNVAIRLNIPVICYGLRTDFQTKVFPGAARLLELAHSLEEFKTICSCGKKSTFNARKVGERFTNKGEQVAIDGENTVTYESFCGKCYLQFVGDIA